jgi:hypothetical protein
MEDALKKINSELRSINHERIVLDVLTRPIFSDIEHEKERRMKEIRQGRKIEKNSLMPNSKANPVFLPKDDPIYIPSFVPQWQKEKEKAEKSLHLQRVSARSVAGTGVVPSINVNYFPEELKHLKTTPVDYALIDKSKPKKYNSLSISGCYLLSILIYYRKKRSVSFAPFAKSLEATNAEMERLKKSLAKADTR